MDSTDRETSLVQAVETSRSLLQPSLDRLQKREATENAGIPSVMEISERLASVVGSLYRLSNREDHEDADGTLKAAYERLELTIKLMDAVPQLAEERRNVVQALALLYALGAGDRTTVPPLRRSSTQMAAVAEAVQRPPPPSSPNIEVGELDANALGLDLEDLDDERPRAADAAPPSEVPPASDRRSSPRVAYEVEVGLVSETHFYAGLSMDVSTGGLFVATYNLQPIGSHIAVTFVLPNGHAVTTNALVCWVREQSEEASPGMGVSFDLDGGDLKQVQEFCSRREPLLIDMD